MSGRVLRLTELRSAIAGQVEDSTGMAHDVHSITFEQHQGLMATNVADADAPTVDEMTRVKNLVAQLVPTLPKNELMQLNLEAAKAITAMATAGIAAVEAAFPNAVGPASTTISPA